MSIHLRSIQGRLSTQAIPTASRIVDHLVSIIVPAFNREKSLMATVKSVCASSYRPIELLIVDDGSTDGTLLLTPQIQDACMKAGISLQILSQPNKGASAARNHGLSAASGDFINFLDSDDELYPEAIRSLADELINNQELNVSYGKVDVIESSTQTKVEEMGAAPSGTDHDWVNYLWHTMGALYRRPVLEAIGGWNINLTLGDDWELSSKVKISGTTYRYLPLIVGAYYKHRESSLTTSRFNLRHCCSVVESALSIHQFARRHGLVSNDLRQRCWNRIFVHALELSVNGHKPESNHAFRICQEIGCSDHAFRLLYCGVRAFPNRWIRNWIYQYIRNRN